MTRDQAIALPTGAVLHHKELRNADQTPPSRQSQREAQALGDTSGGLPTPDEAWAQALLLYHRARRRPVGAAMRYYLRKVRLNQGGYDDLGQYWGCGEPLYQWLCCDLEDDWHYIRASSRDQAKRQIARAVAHTDPAPKFW